MSRFLWYLKQLLPLKYETTYREGDVRYRERWRMWFGRCFARRRWTVPPAITGDRFVSMLAGAWYIPQSNMATTFLKTMRVVDSVEE